ncbi:hypothetical protein D3C87_2022080 [compost metagenome]
MPARQRLAYQRQRQDLRHGLGQADRDPARRLGHEVADILAGQVDAGQDVLGVAHEAQAGRRG